VPSSFKKHGDLVLTFQFVPHNQMRNEIILSLFFQTDMGIVVNYEKEKEKVCAFEKPDKLRDARIEREMIATRMSI
jgi:hypothetical protein